MDQATPAHQTLLRHLRERREDPGLDRSRCLRVSGHLRKRLNLDLSLHAMLQILSITPFEKIPMIQLFSDLQPTKISTTIQSTDFVMKRVGHY